MQNKVVLKNKWYELSENALFPWQPAILFSRMKGRPTKSIVSIMLLTIEF